MEQKVNGGQSNSFCSSTLTRDERRAYSMNSKIRVNRQCRINRTRTSRERSKERVIGSTEEEQRELMKGFIAYLGGKEGMCVGKK